MSAQPSISPLKQHSNKHSPKSTEKTKASPNKKIQNGELSSTSQPITNKKQKVNQFSDEGKHTPKLGSKSQQQPEKNGVKKAQAQKNGAVNGKQQQQALNQVGNGSSNGAQQGGSSKQKSCFNQLCPKDKNISSVSSPQQEQTKKPNANGQYKQAKLEKTGEKVTFCDVCCQRYQEKHFCYYCQQVYFDDYNIDDREWILCDTCDRWCHLHCEEEKIKKAFSNSQSENVQYDCPRCRYKESNSSQQANGNQVNQGKQQQVNTKASKEKPQSVSAANIKQKKSTKNKEKEDKKQDLVEQQIETHVKGQGYGQNIQNAQALSCHQHSVQQSSVVQNNMRRGNSGMNSTSRDQIQNNNQNDYDIVYSLDNFKRKKNKIFQSKSIVQLYQPIQPIQPLLLPNYVTIEDLLKSAGISVCLDENTIKSDLNDMKRMLMESSDSSFKSSSSNQLPNGIHNIQNGQSYSIVVNQE
ncbi:hypothetical protein ABPG74_013992 [Tetrahymena malaccensis]